MNEAVFFQNIAVKLGREGVAETPPTRDDVGAPEFWSRFELDPEKRLDLFQESLEQLGGQVEVCQSADELQQALQRILTDLGPVRVCTWPLAELAGFGLPSVDQSRTLGPYEVLEWGQCSIEEAAQAEVGLTGCAFAIADTGTLVMMADAKRGRSVGLLPSVHIALVHAAQIRTRLGEVMTELAHMEVVPSSVHFISGPSRSSDIENDQSIGVHGPAAVYVLVLDN